MNVAALCRREVVTIGAGQELIDAAQLMRSGHVGFLVVVEAVGDSSDLKVVGVLTDRDLVTAVLAKKADLTQFKVGDVMTRNPLLGSGSQSIATAVCLMREAGVRRLPIVGARGELVGVLSVDDVLDALAIQLTDIAAAIRSEQRLERLVRP